MSEGHLRRNGRDMPQLPGGLKLDERTRIRRTSFPATERGHESTDFSTTQAVHAPISGLKHAELVLRTLHLQRSATICSYKVTTYKSDVSLGIRSMGWSAYYLRRKPLSYFLWLYRSVLPHTEPRKRSRELGSLQQLCWQGVRMRTGSRQRHQLHHLRTGSEELRVHW